MAKKKIMLTGGKSRDPYGEYLIKNNHGIFFRVHRATTEVAVVDPSKSKLTGNAAINTYSQDHYQVLGVLPSANFEDIKAAYKKLVLKFHPDKNKSIEAAAKFLEITAAFEVLSDSEQRLRYDLQKHRPWSVNSRTKAICFSGVNSTTGAQEDSRLLNASRLLLLLLLSFNKPSLLSGISDDLREACERVHRTHINSQAHTINWAVNRALMLSFLSYHTAVASIQTNAFFTGFEREECQPENFLSTINNLINQVTSFPCMTAESLFELTKNDKPASSCSSRNVPQTDFFVSAEEVIVIRLKDRLGIFDGPELMRVLLAEKVKVEDIHLLDSDSGLNGILIPKSSIADIMKFQCALEKISIGGRLFPVTVEGEWLKIGVAFAAPKFGQACD